MLITATIITYNEEPNIARCLESLQGIADEIIVMDSFSTDRTMEICRSFGVTFHQQKWQGYAQQKNDLNALATYDMILSLDADEVLSSELQHSILKMKALGEKGTYAVNRLTNYCGKWIYHSGWYPDIKVRLFPKSCYWEGNLVHEELVCSEAFTPSLLEGHLEHYSYTSHRQHRERADRYSTLTAKNTWNWVKSPILCNPSLAP